MRGHRITVHHRPEQGRAYLQKTRNSRDIGGMLISRLHRSMNDGQAIAQALPPRLFTKRRHQMIQEVGVLADFPQPPSFSGTWAADRIDPKVLQEAVPGERFGSFDSVEGDLAQRWIGGCGRVGNDESPRRRSLSSLTVACAGGGACFIRLTDSGIEDAKRELEVMALPSFTSSTTSTRIYPLARGIAACVDEGDHPIFLSVLEKGASCVYQRFISSSYYATQSDARHSLNIFRFGL